MTASYIYFIQAQDNGPIKIGFTAHNPRKRMVKIQSDCPWPVSLLGAIEGTVSQEKQIHLVLARWRTQGEWFEPSPIVVAAVNLAIEIGVPAPFDERETEEVDESAHPLRRWRFAHNVTQEKLAELLDTIHVNVSRWERGMFVPKRKYWRAIEARTGVTPAELVGFVADLARSQ